MLSNSLINAIIQNMSQGNSSIHSRKRFPRNSLFLSHDSNSKSKVLPSSSCISNTTTGDSQILKTDSLEDNKIILDYSKSSNRINRTVSNANFSARKLWNNASKMARNSIPVNSVIEEESELISMLTKQLHLAESQMRKMQTVLTKAEEGLRTKDQEIGRLKRKIKEWEAKYKNQELLRKKEQRTQANNSEYFYQRCLTLEHKIAEMEKFLADYGMTWVGDTKNAMNIDGDSNNYLDACYDQLVANIDQLNLAAGKGEVHIHHNEKGGGATFKTPSCMMLKFYKNGMIVKEGPLRSYDDPTASSFIRDILDGYFPSELQQGYPDGVPFIIEDRRTELYAGDTASFPGQGYRLGKQSAVDSLLSTNSRRPNIVLQRSGRISPLLKDNASENIPLLSLQTNRLLKSRISLETPSADLFSLRSQILASHNNVCSSSHLQSHINAELARSSRREKRELATKNMEFDMSTNEQSFLSKDALRTQGSNGRYHSSSDRSSYSRPGTAGSRLRPRSKSASLSGGRLNIGMQSILRSKASSTAEINDIGELKIANLASGYSTTNHPRVSKSATYARKSTPPLLHQINEATGKSSELRLKVRSLTGSTVYLVHVFADESVAKLYELLDKAMQTSGHRGYKVVLSGALDPLSICIFDFLIIIAQRYSPKRLERINASLKESGISRDCVLHLVND